MLDKKNSDTQIVSRDNTKRQIRYAVNTCGKDKGWDFKLLTKNFIDKEGTVEDIQHDISSGYALLGGLLGGKSRSKTNVIGSNLILLDIDNSAPLRDESGNPVKDENGKIKTTYTGELTLEAAFAHPFIKKYCALIYTTASHRPEWHKFRLVFVLPEYLEGADAVEACTRFLMQHLPHDPACKDASRVFYGNSKAEFPLVQPGVTLPVEWVQQARGIALQERIEHEARTKALEARKAEFRTRTENQGWDTYQLIQKALSYIPPRNPGSNNYDECRQVLMALADYCGPAEAEALAEEWSPSIKNTTWNIARKIRSFKRGGTSLGTLFHIAKQYGFRFPEQKQYTWEPKEDFSQRAKDQEQFEEHCQIHAEQQQEESLKSSFINRLGRLRKFLNRTRRFNGFGEAPEVKQKKQVDSGIIEFEEGQHQQTIEKLAQQAKETGKTLIVLDNSEGGTGKSQKAGELTPKGLSVDTVFYTSPSHRNPTVAGIEVNYIDLPVRNDGMVAESDKKTPLGNDYIRHPRRGETPNIGGNCFHAGKFTNYAGKGYHGETSLSGSHNPICRSACSNYLSCAGIGNLPKVAGSTFLQDRRNALSGKKIRGSLDSLPDVAKMQVVKEELALLLQGKIELHRVAIVVDEMTQFKIHDQTEADLKDFDTAWMYLQSQIHKSWSLTAELNTEKDQIGNEIDQRQTAVFELESQITATHIQGSLSIPGFNTIDPNLKIIRDLEVEVLILKGQIADLLDQQAEIENQITETQQWITGLPEALATLEPIIFTLRQVLSGEENITSESRFGWTEAMIREKLGDLLNDHAKEALEIVRKFSPNLENLLKEADSVTLDRMSPQDRKGSAAALKFARKAMQKEADKNNRDAIANLPSNCIVPVLDILLDQQDGSFRIAYGNLTIYTKNNRHRDQLKQADFTLVLDGTETRESLAKKLECDPSEIVVIRQKTKSYKNLKIIQITGMGLLGSDRSETAKQRVAAVGAAIKEKYGCNNVGIIDHKKALDPGEESEAGYWHHDNRGSNRYKEKTALLTIGTPFQNIGHLQMLYTTMTGDCNPAKGNPAFDAFVQEFVENEMQQGGWRLRSTRRLDERLYWYIASDADLSYLKERFPDAEFEIIPAFKITPEAGSTGERMNWSILQAFKTLEETKQKITTGAIAKIVGCNRSRISQIANEVAGGFASFRKVLISLLSSLYRTVNTLAEPLTEDEQFAAKTYLPLLLEENTLDPTELVKEVVAIASTLGWKSFSCILAALNPHHRAKLLGNMLIFLPEEWHKELLEISIPAIAT